MSIFRFRHCRTISTSWRRHITCRKWGSPLNHSSHRQMGIRRLQNLHTKKPRPHPGTPVWTNSLRAIFLYPRFGILTGFDRLFPKFLTDFSQIDFIIYRLFLNRLTHTYLRIWTSPINTDLHYSFSSRSSPCSSHRSLRDLITPNFFLFYLPFLFSSYIGI